MIVVLETEKKASLDPNTDLRKSKFLYNARKKDYFGGDGRYLLDPSKH